MKNPKHMSAGIISTCLALVLMLFTYVALAKVDLVYMQDGVEICRQNDVSVFSEITDPAENLPEGESLSFTYTDGDQKLDFDHTDVEFKLAIGKLVISNLIGFKWSESNQVIIMTAK